MTALSCDMNGARSHEGLIVWQLAHELQLGVYALIDSGHFASDKDFVKQLRGASSSAPRLIAEGFGRYYPGEFSRYLRNANGELKETFDALRDGIDRGYLVHDQVVPLQRLSRRASKAATELMKYLRTATPPHETPPPASRQAAARVGLQNPRTSEPQNPRTPEPPEPPEPPNPEPRNLRTQRYTRP